jgi:hypothetical protein
VTEPWQRELRVFLLTAVYVAFLGPVAGLVWWQLAPKQTKQTMTVLLNGSATPFHVAVDADAWFLLVAAIAGLVTALAVFLLRWFGPGAVAGLAFGGAAAGVIADRVGYLAERGHTVAAMQAAGVAPAAADLLDFKVRAIGVIAVWPMVALIVYTTALAMRDRYRSLP